MRLSKREAGVLNFINRTVGVVLNKGATRVRCANKEVRLKLIERANIEGIMTVSDGLEVILAKGKTVAQT